VKLLTGFFSLAVALSAGADYKIYVATDGAAGADGSKKHPFATLEQARDTIRAARKDGVIESDEAVTVYLYPGDYYLTESFKLTEEDSGTAEAPVTYCALKRGKAHLYGGVSLPPPPVLRRSRIRRCWKGLILLSDRRSLSVMCRNLLPRVDFLPLLNLTKGFPPVLCCMSTAGR